MQPETPAVVTVVAAGHKLAMRQLHLLDMLQPEPLDDVVVAVDYRPQPRQPYQRTFE